MHGEGSWTGWIEKDVRDFYCILDGEPFEWWVMAPGALLCKDTERMIGMLAQQETVVWIEQP